MQKSHKSTLRRLLAHYCSAARCDALLRTVHVAPTIMNETTLEVPRAVISQALNLILFAELLDRVPSAHAYMRDRESEGRHIVFDHGAVRTVDLAGMGELPPGEEAITRVLRPLGYRLGEVYPLDRLNMTGRSYTHKDLPEDLPQFFVSELHPDRYSADFQAAVSRVTGSSHDPLTPAAQDSLAELAERGDLSFEETGRLLPILRDCFQRLHSTPRSADYEILLEESVEMSWIATEGNAFNHATDRVPDLEQLVAEQRGLGRPLKDLIETSRSGRVRQTAFWAEPVQREFIDANGVVLQRRVPGSFFEFIQRDHLLDPKTHQLRLDLAFDSANAEGIFKMTTAA